MTLEYLKHLLTSSELEIHEITYDIGKWPLNKMLKWLIPVSVSWPSSFETVGSIIHVNLREELLPYKFLIGLYSFSRMESCWYIFSRKHFTNETLSTNKDGGK